MTTESSNSTRLVETDLRNRTKIDTGHMLNGEYWPAHYRYNSKKRFYEYLNELNSGQRNGAKWQNQKYHNYLDNKYVIETFAANLELTPDERQRAIGFFMSQNLSKWGIPKYTFAWAVCSVVVHNNARDSRKCHPLSSGENTDPLFAEMVETLKLSRKAQMSTYGKVENKINQKR